MLALYNMYHLYTHKLVYIISSIHVPGLKVIRYYITVLILQKMGECLCGENSMQHGY